MKIYTRRGDAGETDLFAGGRVAKDDLRVDAYGEVDELNACLGACAAATNSADLRDALYELQARLFDLGAYLATPEARAREKAGTPAVTADHIAQMEQRIDRLEEELPPLQSFILPGGSEAAARFHLARTVCRRAERRVVALHRQSALDPEPLRFLNRLSDLLFVMARAENRRAGVADVPWRA